MRIDLGFNYQLNIYLNKMEKREGVSSKVATVEDMHILLWDFDNVKLPNISKVLTAIQTEYKLSTIYIVSSSKNRYHAYCFTAFPLQAVINILSATPLICIQYLRLGMVRGYYTLRISKRQRDNIKLVSKLVSDVTPNVSPFDVTVSEYMTANRGDVENG